MALTRPPTSDTTPEDRRIAELYRARSVEEPSARIDAAIRAAARAGESRPERAPPWWLPWRVPFAVAAVAVVSASLAILVHEERPEPLAEAPPPAAVAPPPAAQPAPESAAGSRVAAPEPAQKRTREAEKSRGPEQAKPSITADAPAEAKPQSRSDAPAEMARRESPAAGAVDQEGRAAARSTIGMRGLEAPEIAGERAGGEPKTAAAAPAAAPERAPPAPAVSSAPAAPAQRAKIEARDTVDITALKAELEREPPRRWVERIAMLRREGRNAEADALAAEFRRRFPDEPLPPTP